jgi:hypothetical protein
VSIIDGGKGETVDLSEADGMSEFLSSNSTKRWQGKGKDVINGGKGLPDVVAGQHLSIIDMSAEVKIPGDYENSKGQDLPDNVVSYEATFVHEQLGHGMSVLYNRNLNLTARDKLSQTNAVAAENIYYRATGQDIYRNGTNHNKRYGGSSMDKKEASSIPEYLKPKL